VQDLESAAIAREGFMQEEIARALARERESRKVRSLPWRERGASILMR